MKKKIWTQRVYGNWFHMVSRVFQTLACVSAMHAVLAMQQNEPAACDTDIIELTGLGKIKGAVAGAVRYFRGVPYVCSRFLFF